MTPEQWGRVRSEVENAVSLPQQQRCALLEELSRQDAALAGEVRAFLEFETRATQIFSIDQWLDAVPSLLGGVAAGTVVGRYRILAEIGRGGMGAVYRAERADGEFQQIVALKLLQELLHTPQLVERFRQERQILARLSDPGISRLLDGGVTAEGRPYAVMEFVDGITIDRYCQEHALDLRARLLLFLRVAAAVQHAHQQLVLHLDIKPANILVTDQGEPRLLDFGVSRLLSEGGQQTVGGDATLKLLTPRYASPEQVAGEPLGVASDVFSLGTLLYELLTGTLPYPMDDAAPLEAARIVRETPPRLPSDSTTLVPAADLRGDLDAILLKALRKEPEKRYLTVAALAQDIGDHLNSRPVQARRGTLQYRAAKFMHRNRTYLAVAAIVVIIVAVCVALVIRSAVIARRHQQLAEKRLQDVRDLAHEFIFNLDPQLDGIPGTVAVRGSILKTGLKYLDAMAAEAGNDADLKMELARGYMQMSQQQYFFVRQSAGDWEGAKSSEAKARRLATEALMAHPDDPRMIKAFLFVGIKGAQTVDEARGDIESYDSKLQKMWQTGQPLLAPGAEPDGLVLMASVSGELATDRTGNGALWSFADPRGGLEWALRSREIGDRAMREHPDTPAAINAAVDAIYDDLTMADSYINLADRQGLQGIIADATRRAADPRFRDPRLAQIQHVVSDYRSGWALTLHDLPQAASLLKLDEIADEREQGSNVKLDLEAAIRLYYRSIIELEEGQQRLGTEHALRAYEAMDRIDRETPGDINAHVQLVAMGLQIGEEPLAPRADRQRLLERAVSLAQDYASRFPHVLSAQLRIALCESLLGGLLRDEGHAQEAASHFELARGALRTARAGLRDVQQVDFLQSQVEAAASGRLDESGACVQRLGARYFYAFLNGDQQVRACSNSSSGRRHASQ